MYLYIFEDGTTAQAATAPTDADIEQVLDGTLEVMKFDPAANRFFYMVTGTAWTSVQQAHVHKTCSEQTFHWHEK